MRIYGKNISTNFDIQELKTRHANTAANGRDTHPTATTTRTTPTNQRTTINPAIMRNNHSHHRHLLRRRLLRRRLLRHRLPLPLHHHPNTTKGVTKEIKTANKTNKEMGHIIMPIQRNNRKERSLQKITPTRTTIAKMWDEH
jgi:hypothetical protein